jgi:hypothetical protein
MLWLLMVAVRRREGRQGVSTSQPSRCTKPARRRASRARPAGAAGAGRATWCVWRRAACGGGAAVRAQGGSSLWTVRGSSHWALALRRLSHRMKRTATRDPDSTQAGGGRRGASGGGAARRAFQHCHALERRAPSTQRGRDLAPSAATAHQGWAGTHLFVWRRVWAGVGGRRGHWVPRWQQLVSVPPRSGRGWVAPWRLGACPHATVQRP